MPPLSRANSKIAVRTLAWHPCRPARRANLQIAIRSLAKHRRAISPAVPPSCRATSPAVRPLLPRPPPAVRPLLPRHLSCRASFQVTALGPAPRPRQLESRRRQPGQAQPRTSPTAPVSRSPYAAWPGAAVPTHPPRQIESRCARPSPAPRATSPVAPTCRSPYAAWLGPAVPLWSAGATFEVTVRGPPPCPLPDQLCRGLASPLLCHLIGLGNTEPCTTEATTGASLAARTTSDGTGRRDTTPGHHDSKRRSSSCGRLRARCPSVVCRRSGENGKLKQGRPSVSGEAA
ncbi:hypothetical protein DFJ69_2541 [Thermomonospora umbrina]|uniref:Uncharacterized protein n=1 Tax=Thermomonospora umbrina TaxID=111806 RepID=A0A3D9SVS1_9ACTN|nr:hypothetical protein DFJ69_2541 [Thermomonospora umbrina]